MKILQRDNDTTRGVTHRASITGCPHCDFEEPHTRIDREWFKLQQIEFVVMDSVHIKMSALVVVSACPKCGELSWVHCDVKHAFLMDRYLKKLQGAIIEKHTQCLINGFELWAKSPCRTCQQKKVVTIDYLRPHVRCIAQDFFVPKDCKQYKATP